MLKMSANRRCPPAGCYQLRALVFFFFQFCTEGIFRPYGLIKGFSFMPLFSFTSLSTGATKDPYTDFFPENPCKSWHLSFGVSKFVNFDVLNGIRRAGDHTENSFLCSVFLFIHPNVLPNRRFGKPSENSIIPVY